MSYHSQNGEVLYSYSDMAVKKIVPGGFSSHYYTVTGIIYNVEKDGQYTTVLEISNWGEKQYIDYLEYEEQIGKGFDFQNNSMKDIVFNEFGNGILYMRKM